MTDTEITWDSAANANWNRPPFVSVTHVLKCLLSTQVLFLETVYFSVSALYFLITKSVEYIYWNRRANEYINKFFHKI